MEKKKVREKGQRQRIDRNSNPSTSLKLELRYLDKDDTLRRKRNKISYEKSVLSKSTYGGKSFEMISIHTLGHYLYPIFFLPLLFGPIPGVCPSSPLSL